MFSTKSLFNSGQTPTDSAEEAFFLIGLSGCADKSPLAGKWVTDQPIVVEDGGIVSSVTISANFDVKSNNLEGSVFFYGMPSFFVDEFGYKFPVLDGRVSSSQIEFFVNPFNPGKIERDTYKFTLRLTKGQLVGIWTQNHPDPDVSEVVVFTKVKQ